MWLMYIIYIIYIFDIPKAGMPFVACLIACFGRAQVARSGVGRKERGQAPSTVRQPANIHNGDR